MSYGMNGWCKEIPGGDLISRAAAIDEAYEISIDGQKFNVVQVETLMGLPSAQPEKRTEKRTETRACDLISRQAAIDEIDEWIKAFRENGHKESAADACLIQDGIIQLPSAQPEQKKGKWEYHSNPNIRGGMNPEDAYCSVCGFHICTPEVDDFDDYNFCPNCGADMRGEQDE